MKSHSFTPKQYGTIFVAVSLLLITSPACSPGPGSPVSLSLLTPASTPTTTPQLSVTPLLQPMPVSGWFLYRIDWRWDPHDASPSTVACHLYRSALDSSEVTNLTPESHDCVASPAISPDGQRIAYLNGYIRNMSAGLPGSLVVMQQDTRATSVFKPGPLSSGYLVWSKDGSQIAYYDMGDFRWHIIDAHDGTPVATTGSVTPDKWYLPNLSPDGRYRASYCGELNPSSFKYDRVCITELANDPRPLGGYFDETIAWSPDGQWIGYSTGNGSYLMRSDGSDIIQVSSIEVLAWWFEG